MRELRVHERLLVAGYVRNGRGILKRAILISPAEFENIRLRAIHWAR